MTDVQAQAPDPLSDYPFGYSPPWSFDERPAEGSLLGLDPPLPLKNWRKDAQLTAVVTQQPCDSCTSCAIASTMSDLAVIVKRRDATPLSAGYLHRCIGRCDCRDRIQPDEALDTLMSRPLPARRAGDHPYVLDCHTAAGLIKIKDWASIEGPGKAKRVLSNYGPIVAEMDLYQDFWDFRGRSVYEHKGAGRIKDTHTVEIVGYDDAAGWWLVKNSFGPGWGDDGYAKVAYGQCRILSGLGAVHLAI